jgi:putative sterol carrier protein
MAAFEKPSTAEVFQMIDAALKYDPSTTRGKEGVYQFNLQGDDGGIYQMIIDADVSRAMQGDEKEAQVTLTIDHDAFKDLVAGTLNPTAAFMSGRLKIKRNMGLALKLQSILHSFSF